LIICKQAPTWCKRGFKKCHTVLWYVGIAVQISHQCKPPCLVAQYTRMLRISHPLPAGNKAPCSCKVQHRKVVHVLTSETRCHPHSKPQGHSGVATPKKPQSYWTQEKRSRLIRTVTFIIAIGGKCKR